MAQPVSSSDRRANRAKKRKSAQTCFVIKNGRLCFRNNPYPFMAFLLVLAILIFMQFRTPDSTDDILYAESELLDSADNGAQEASPNSEFESMKNRSNANVWNSYEQLDWQRVSGMQEKFFVYSAYYIKKHHAIRIVAVTATTTTEHVRCLLCGRKLQPCITVDGELKVMQEHWKLDYSAYFVICPIPSELNVNAIHFVSVTPSFARLQILPEALGDSHSFVLDVKVRNVLPVQFPGHKIRDFGPGVEFSVCVKPIHYGYDDVLQFVEWMEFHQLMGVSHFTFFNKSIGPEVSLLMKEIYGNIVTVLPWNLPLISQEEIRTEGIFAALNDCIYRHRRVSKYLILVDLDEMIVPRKAKNYTGLLAQLTQLDKGRKIGAYLAKNAFFYLNWPNQHINWTYTNDTVFRSVGSNLVTIMKTRRLQQLNPFMRRSKYICKPDYVVEVGNHFVWEYEPGYAMQFSPSSLMVLHHYRICEDGGDACTQSPSVVDRSTYTFAHTLVLNVAEKLKQYGEKCGADVSEWIPPTINSA